MCARPIEAAAPAAALAMRRRQQAGLTLIELLVAMVVSMLVGIAAVATSLTFNATQRQAVSTGNSSASLVTTLSGIKLQVSQAGLGFYQDGQYLCPRMNLSLNGVSHFDNSAFTPLTGSVDQPRFDRLGAVYADETLAGARVLLRGNVTATSTEAYLDSLLPKSVALPEPMDANKLKAIMLSTPGGANPCTIKTITGWTAPDPLIEKPTTLTMAASGKYNQGAFSAAVTYTARNDYVSVLGDLNWWRFRVVDAVGGGTPTGSTEVGNLIVEKPLSNESAVIERDVVAFKVQYGLSATMTESGVSQWVDPVAPWDVLDVANEIGRVRAVRVGMIVRGERARDRGANSASCSSTTPDQWVTDTNSPLVLFKGSTQKIDITPPSPTGTDWRCYRYRQTEVVIPMRNVVYGRDGAPI